MISPHLPRHIAFIAALLSAGTCSAVAGQAYLYSSFRGKGDGLHLAFSPDGLNWKDLDRVFLRPTVGERLFRDPHLSRDATGLYHLVWTSGWRDLGIGYATSRDLVQWSPQRHLPLAARISGAKNAWAPEILHDDAQNRFVITWSSSVDGWFTEDAGGTAMSNRTYCVTTRDFVEFTEPELLIEPGFSHVDTTLVPWQGRFVAIFTRDDGGPRRSPYHAAIADNPTGPYRLLLDKVSTQASSEGGATVVPLADRCLLYAPLPSQRRVAVYSTRDWVTWEEVVTPGSSAINESGQGQGNILLVPEETVEKLRVGTQALPSTIMAESVPAPILPGLNADPALRVFGNTYYLFPTSDRPNWGSNSFSVWTSTDLKDWRAGGTILNLPASLSWARKNAWTPDCVERDGKYYLYFCAETKIGVAAAARPEGPYVDAIGKPLLQTGDAVRAKTIAPHVFIDDDGQAYLYYGSGQSLGQVVRLGTDMVSVVGAPQDLPITDFAEGLVVFKRRSVYYFMWTVLVRGQPSRVCYGISDSPLGPIRRPAGNDTVLRSDAPIIGVGDHSVLNIPGTDRWYVTYHREALPGGGPDRREVCLTRMEFGGDGSILPMDALAPAFGPTSEGEPLVNGRGRP